MICPKCGGRSKVKDSRPADDGTYRRRECLACGHLFTTYEISDVQKARYEQTVQLYTVIKSIINKGGQINEEVSSAGSEGEAESPGSR